MLDSSGTLLAAGDDPNNTSASRSLGVERTVETEIEDNIRRALTPYLGPDNFRASVKAEVNTDTRQTEETIFDPESRVERRCRSVRANENNNQKTGGRAGQRRPEPAADPRRHRLPRAAILFAERPQGGNDQLRDELEEDRHGLQRLFASPRCRSGRRQPAAPDDDPRQGRHAGTDRQARIADIQKMVTSATGFDDKRGDVIDVSAVEFIDGLDGEPS